jgi:hypothetical protein
MRRLPSQMSIMKTPRKHTLPACYSRRQRHGDLADHHSLAGTICDPFAPSRAGSKRSPRGAWFPQLSAATAQLVNDVEVDHYTTSAYPEGCDIAGLKYDNKKMLEKRWSELARAALITYGPQAVNCDDYGRPIRPRRPKRPTVKSQSDPWYKRVPSLLTEHFTILTEHFTNPGSAYTTFAQIKAASLAVFKSMPTVPATTVDGLPERIEDEFAEAWPGWRDHIFEERDRTLFLCSGQCHHCPRVEKAIGNSPQPCMADQSQNMTSSCPRPSTTCPAPLPACNITRNFDAAPTLRILGETASRRDRQGCQTISCLSRSVMLTKDSGDDVS